MAEGDYVTHHNTVDTDQISPAAGGEQSISFDETAEDKIGTGIVLSGNPLDLFTLGETGHFLVMCSCEYGPGSGDVGDAGQEKSCKCVIKLAGTNLLAGHSHGYMAHNNTGVDNFIFFSPAIIDVATTVGNGDELTMTTLRIDDSLTVPPTTVPGSRVGITILKLKDTWNYGRYESSSAFATSTTDNVDTTATLGTTIEQDSPFVRTGNVVKINTNNLVLAIYSLRSEDASPATTEAEFQSFLELAGAQVPGSWASTFIRGSNFDNCIWGGMSCMVLLEPTSGDDLTLEVKTRENGGADFEAHLCLLELPNTAKACIVEATTGDMNTAHGHLVFNWDTLPYIDTDIFTHTAGNSNIEVDVADKYIVMASQAYDQNAAEAATDAIPALQFRINATDNENSGGSAYNQNVGTAGHCAIATATMISGLVATDDIHVRNDRLNTTAVVAVDEGAFSAIQYISLFPAGNDPIDGTIAADTTFSSTLTGNGALTGTGTFTGTFAATLLALGTLAGSLPADTTFAGTLVGTGALVGTLPTDTTFSGTLGGLGALTGTLPTDTTFSGTLAGTSVLAGTVPADTTFAGTLLGNGALDGSIAAAFTFSATHDTGIVYTSVGGFFLFTASEWADTIMFRMEAKFRSTNGGSVAVRLFDESDMAAVAGSEITTTSTTMTRRRTAPLVLTDDNEYRIQVGVNAGATGAIIRGTVLGLSA